MKWVLGITGVIFAGLLALVVMTSMWGIGTYNSVVGKNEAVNSAWSQVQNVYQRRSDLIPNIVETVKAASKFEKDTLTQVAQARASVGQFKVDSSILNNPEQFAQFQQSQGILGSALNRLMVITERYPDLKANSNFQGLMVELEGTENRIAVERRTFNQTAEDYNATIKRFPGNLVANYMGFKEKPYFQADQQAQTAPKVSFSDPAPVKIRAK